MFDLDAGKLLIVGVIMLIFIPPKDLPRVLRQVGQFVGRMRRMAAEFQGQFMDAMREADTEDLRREAKKLAEAARVDVGFDALKDLDRQMVAQTTKAPAVKPVAVDEEFASVTPVDTPPAGPKPEDAAAKAAPPEHRDGERRDPLPARSNA